MKLKTVGQEGLKALKTLEKQAVIVKDESGYYKVKDKSKYAIFSFELIKAHFLFLAKKYNSEHIRSNYICYEVESLNEAPKYAKKRLKRFKSLQ